MKKYFIQEVIQDRNGPKEERNNFKPFYITKLENYFRADDKQALLKAIESHLYFTNKKAAICRLNNHIKAAKSNYIYHKKNHLRKYYFKYKLVEIED